MDTLKKLQMLARVLREHRGYKGNKESDNYSNRFNFKFDKKGDIIGPYIDIYNAEKGANLFLWPELIELCHGLDLSHYITYDEHDLKEVVLHIY